MSIDYGFEDPVWMSKRVIELSHPLLLKKAVVEVIDHLERAHEEGSSPFEIIDRLVQVSSTGKYIAPEQKKSETHRKVFDISDGELSEEQEQEIRDPIKGLNNLPTAEKMDDADDYKDWLKQMNIPDIDDYLGEEDDDEEPESS